jgi:putative hydrolase of the HAD superfamily
MATIKAVLWDFGGVFTSSPFEAFNRYEKAKGLPHDFIRKVNSTNPKENAWALYEQAKLTPPQFNDLFLKESTELGHPVPGADIMPLLAGQVRPAMVEALRECKKHFKVGCITNNMASGRAPPRRSAAPMEGAAPQAPASAGSVIMPLFDVVIESSKVGIRKPDPRIYQIMCEQIGIPAENSVYLDDLGDNCKAAAQLGMIAIKVVTVDETLDKLESATGLTFARDVQTV